MTNEKVVLYMNDLPITKEVLFVINKNCNAGMTKRAVNALFAKGVSDIKQEYFHERDVVVRMVKHILSKSRPPTQVIDNPALIAAAAKAARGVAPAIERSKAKYKEL